MFNVVNVLNFVRKHDRAILTIATTVFAAAAAWFSATETASMSEKDKEDIKLGSVSEKAKIVVKTHPKTTFCLLATATAAGAGFKLGASAIASASTAAAVAFKERDRIAREARAFLGDEKYRELMDKVQKAEQSELAKLQLRKPSKDAGDEADFDLWEKSLMTKGFRMRIDAGGRSVYTTTNISQVNYVRNAFNEFYKDKGKVSLEWLLKNFGIEIKYQLDRVHAKELWWEYGDGKPWKYIEMTPYFDRKEGVVVLDIEEDPMYV